VAVASFFGRMKGTSAPNLVPIFPYNLLSVLRITFDKIFDFFAAIIV